MQRINSGPGNVPKNVATCQVSNFKDVRKNKEQLVQKYACRTVKFQVYVKEGKAALKATPVKD